MAGNANHLNCVLLALCRVALHTETTGTCTSFDQILQFAAVRADDELNVFDTFDVRCRLLPYVVPAPGALLTTGVTVADITSCPLSHFEMM
jgi:exodeoxyribonuclease-1